MKTALIVGISVIGLIIIYLIIQNSNKPQTQNNGSGSTPEQQISEQAQNNWLVATSTILGGLGGIFQNLGNLNFGGSSSVPPGAVEFNEWEQYGID